MATSKLELNAKNRKKATGYSFSFQTFHNKKAPASSSPGLRRVPIFLKKFSNRYLS